MMKTGMLYDKGEISEYLNNASDYLMKKWVADGMPVRIEEGRWMAHTRNLEEFFVWYTRKRAKADDIKQEYVNE